MKYLKGIMIFLAVLLCSLLFSISAYAYTYPYNPETGFEVPYTVVTLDALAEPASVVGEVRETSPDSGVLTLSLPNGKRIECAIPTLYYQRTGDRERPYHPAYAPDSWSVYDESGALTDDIKWPCSYDSWGARASIPVYYKGKLFSRQFGNDYGYVYMIDQDTFSVTAQVWESGKTRGYDIENEVYHEFPNNNVSSCGYEIAPGNFVYAESLDYVNITEDSNSFMTFESDGYFFYSCDGIWFMRVACPKTALKLAHYTVNGIDSITLKCIENNNVVYATYPLNILKDLWNEYFAETPHIYLNGVELGFTQPPVIIDGTTFMPLRFLLETAGATVKWNESDSTTEISYCGKVISIKNDDNTVYINDTALSIGSRARIINGKMMIPLRAVSELLGFNITWRQDTRSILVDVPTGVNYNTFSLFPVMEQQGINIVINGVKTKASLSCEGKTLLSTDTFDNFFALMDKENSEEISFYQIYRFEIDNVKSELKLRDSSEFKWDLMGKEICNDASAIISDIPFKTYAPFLPVIELDYEGNNIPVYEIDKDLLQYSFGINNDYYICVEECADRMDDLHYEWVAEENTLYIYISDDMVTFDDALKMILDKKGIDHNTPYKGDAYKDIEIMQKYSDNDLSSLVNAGITVGAISESDCADGMLRPTRNISHLDLKRMLNGMGYDYTYDYESANKPVTQSEFNAVLEEL